MPAHPSPTPSDVDRQQDPIDDAMSRFMDLVAPDPYECPSLACFPNQDPDEKVVAIVELDTGDPHDALLGLQIPDVFGAVAFCGSGTAWSADRAASAPPRTERARVRIMHGVRRDGSWAALLHRPGHGTDRSHGGPDDGPLGHIDDLLRRALGLPTAPPVVSPLHFWAGLWLSIVRSSLHDERREEAPPWEEVAALHPAMLGPGDPRVFDAGFDRRVLGGEDLVAAGRAFAEVHDWAYLRSCPATIDSDAAYAGFADWLDDGSFSRLALAGGQSLHRRLEDITGTAMLRWGAPAARRLRTRLDTVLEAWELDPATDPNVGRPGRAVTDPVDGGDT